MNYDKRYALHLWNLKVPSLQELGLKTLDTFFFVSRLYLHFAETVLSRVKE